MITVPFFFRYNTFTITLYILPCNAFLQTQCDLICEGGVDDDDDSDDDDDDGIRDFGAGTLDGDADDTIRDIGVDKSNGDDGAISD